MAIQCSSVMAAFYKHICLWSNCGKKCSSLVELIDHIEVIHIERDPIALEKQELTQPAAIALSYINCFFAESTRPVKKNPKQDGGNQSHLSVTPGKGSPALQVARKQIVNEPDNYYDDENCSISDAESEDSCNSWSTNTSQESDLMLSRIALIEENREGKRRYVCPVKGCGKRYKNVNGIKYHARNGHNRKVDIKQKTPKPIARSRVAVPSSTPEEQRKGYECHCGKSYKSQSGLRHHQNTQHGKKVSSGKKETSLISELHSKGSLQTQVKLPHLDLYGGGDSSKLG